MEFERLCLEPAPLLAGLGSVAGARPRKRQARVQIKHDHEIGQTHSQQIAETIDDPEPESPRMSLVGERGVMVAIAEYRAAGRQRRLDHLAQVLPPVGKVEQQLGQRLSRRAVFAQKHLAQFPAKFRAAWLAGHDKRYAPAHQLGFKKPQLQALSGSFDSLECHESGRLQRLLQKTCLYYHSPIGILSFVTDIAANLESIREQIRETAERAGRDPASVQLVAVSKTLPPEVVRQAAAAGQLSFGENRVQEAQEKIPALTDAGLEWRLIGHLQSNKARRAVELFNVIETIDSPRLATTIDRIAGEMGKRMPILLEVNVGEETQKAGVEPAELGPLVDFARRLPNLELRGLMAIPPYEDDPERSRPYFRRLARLLQEINRSLDTPLTDLSMGMSHDFRVAIQEGATLVRIGTAIFGARTK